MTAAFGFPGMPGPACFVGLIVYVLALGTALRLGRNSLSMTHFVVEAEAEDITPSDPALR